MAALRTEYQLKLMALEDGVLRAGRIVQDMVVPAVEVLVRGDSSAVRGILSRDDEVDAQIHQLEGEVHETILLQAPVADDLRLLMSLAHAARSVERIGDYCVNLARLAHDLDPEGADPDRVAEVHQMALLAERAVRTGLDCLGHRGASGLEAVDEVDRLVDLLREGLLTRLTEHAALGGRGAPWAVVMVRAVGHLERIGDHSVTIAEFGPYIATAERRPPRSLRTG